jgi:hypothetical protein
MPPVLVRTRLVALLAVLGSVTWRRGEYFTGALDPVVLAKAFVTLVALGLAFALAQPTSRRRLGTASLWWLGVVLVSSLFGALTADHLRAGGIVAVRVVMLGATVFFLLRAAPALRVLTDIAWACGAVAVVAALTGLPGMDGGRLAGGLPAMAPNELALLAGVGVALLAWRTLLGGAGWATGFAAVFLLGIIWESGSRTVLLGLVAGAAVMAVQIRRPRVGIVVGGLVLGSLGVIGAAFTGSVTAFLERDGAGISTVESRFIAWREALTWADSAWQDVFGGGLSVKVIHVRGQYWDTQPLDSSWASLLVQTGVLGLVSALIWVLWVARGALRAPYEHRVLFLGLWVFLVGHSILESGLFDATPSFLMFLAVSLLAEGGSRDRLWSEHTEPGAADAVPSTARAGEPEAARTE